MLLPSIKGKKHYDYRIIIGLSILRIFLRKSYEDYEVEMRNDSRICNVFQLHILPGKSTIHRGMQMLNMKLIYKINFLLVQDQTRRALNILVDSSGIRTDKKSSWFCFRIKKEISKKDCDKLHLAVCLDLLLILNWRITAWRKNDSPFLIILLKPFYLLKIVLADKGYLSRINFQFVSDKKGALFIPFKKNSTAKPKSHPAWKTNFNLWKKFNTIYMGIYHQRSKIESVFSVIKKRFGDKTDCKSCLMRRKEIALRLIAYNLRILICYQYAVENNLPLWVRAKKK